MGLGETIFVLLALLLPLACLGVGALLMVLLFLGLKKRAQTARTLVTEQHAAQLLAQQKQGTSVTHPLDLPHTTQVYGVCSFRHDYRAGRYEVSFTLANAHEQPSVHVGAVLMEVKPAAGFILADLGASTLKITLEDTRYTYHLDGAVIGYSRFSYPGIFSNEVHPENVVFDPAGAPLLTGTRSQGRQETYQILDARRVELAQIKLGKTFRIFPGARRPRARSPFLRRMEDLRREGPMGAWIRFSDGQLDVRTKALILGHFLREKLFTYSMR